MKILSKFILLLFIFPFVTNGQEKDYSLAKVGKKTQGVYIFINAEPFQPYDYIATIEVSDNWIEKSPAEAFEKIINKAKKKYPNFNGIIFHTDDFHKADIIKFTGLDLGGGGFHTGDKVTFQYNGKLIYGEVISLNNVKQEATTKYADEFNAIQNKTLRYDKLRGISDDEYAKAINNELSSKKIFLVSQKVTWLEGHKNKYGIIIEMNLQKHEANIRYLNEFGQEKSKIKDLEDLVSATEIEYTNYNESIKSNIEKHKFKSNDKVTLTMGFGKIIHATIVSFDEANMKATIKFISDKGIEKNSTVDAFDLTKEE